MMIIFLFSSVGMAIAPSLLSWKPSLKLKNHLYDSSPHQFLLPPHASFPRITLRKNIKKLMSFKCFFNESSVLINKSWLGEMEIKENHDDDPVEIVGRSIAKAVIIKAALAAALVVGLVLMYYPSCALAASGGRIGGNSSFSSSSSSSSRRSFSSYFDESDDDDDEPLDVLIVELVVLGFMLWMLLNSSKGKGTATEKTTSGDLTATEKTSVLKLQVGLLGLVRSLQKDLNRIAETADTSTPEGLHYVLTEAVLALFQHPDYFISAYSSVDVKRSMKEGEKRFNQLSIKERRKFDEETLVNVNGKKKQSSTSIRAGGITNEYIVITILVAAEGVVKLPTINNSNDLKEALQKLASIPARRKKAVEVLWTPQNEGDTLSERQFLDDYPFLRPL